MTTWTTREEVLEFAIADESATYSTLTFLDLGMLNQKNGPSQNVDTRETTGDRTPNYTKTYEAAARDITFGGTGVAYSDAVHNQETLKAHVYNCWASGQQPKVWWRCTNTITGEGFYGAFIVNSFEKSSSIGDSATFNFDSTLCGPFVYTPGS
jgi:hypothetical protein